MRVVARGERWYSPFPSSMDSHSPRKTWSIFVRSLKSSLMNTAFSQSKRAYVGFGPLLSPTVSWFAIVTKIEPSVVSCAGCSSNFMAHPVPFPFAL